MKKIDGSAMILKMRDDVSYFRNVVARILKNIDQIEEHGLPPMKDFCLGITPQDGACSICFSECFEYWVIDYKHVPNYPGSDDRIHSMCNRCARQFCPYLFYCLRPYIQQHEDFFREMYFRSDSPLGPITEERVPEIMEILNRYWKLKAFI
jgi:hypothetical protein